MGHSQPKAAPGITRGQVAELKEKGLQAREIAQLLHISTQAVHWHLSKIKELATAEEVSA